LHFLRLLSPQAGQQARFDIWTSCRSPGIKDEGVVIRRDDEQKRVMLVRAIHGVMRCGSGCASCGTACRVM
ncbi:TPA: hypothetical protein ACUKWK_005309, partial [Escherichia coli]